MKPQRALKALLLQAHGRVYYRAASRKFDREMDAVLAGQRANRKASRDRKARYNLVRNIHMLEKGLTMQPRRRSFAHAYIADAVQQYGSLTAAGGLGAAERAWATDVLEAYFAATAESDAPEVTKARQAFDALRSEPSYVAGPGDSGPHAFPELAPQVSIEDLEQLARTRRSTRWFRPDPVPRDVVDNAVRVAMESPTACNRQPYRFVIAEGDAVQPIAAIPMGTRGYSEQIPGIIVVVGDLSAFFDERDRHVIYIDSCLASMGLLLALQTQGVATCCINWPDIAEREQQMQRVLGLAPHERVIMLIAYGYADPQGLVPYSAKRELDNVRTYVDVS